MASDLLCRLHLRHPLMRNEVVIRAIIVAITRIMDIAEAGEVEVAMAMQGIKNGQLKH